MPWRAAVFVLFEFEDAAFERVFEQLAPGVRGRL